VRSLPLASDPDARTTLSGVSGARREKTARARIVTRHNRFRPKGNTVKAIWNGQLIAESNDTVVVEGNHYFPLPAVKKEYLEDSFHTSVCPWKGTANYYTLNVDGKKNEDAVWYYQEPSNAARQIKDHVAFWKGVSVQP
jgi:uncharacterized protein (DUF427 family)